MTPPKVDSLKAVYPQAVEVCAPATIANLGPGFDILGLALEAPFDTIYAERTSFPGVVIESITGDQGRLPLDPAKNTAGVSALYLLGQLGIKDQGVRLHIEKGLPLASGLGSSAASAVAGAVAVNALFGSPLSAVELLDASVEGEALVSGRHADNVAPALLGGIVLVAGLSPDLIFPLPTPPNLVLAMITPDVAVPTAEARAVLPKTITLKEMVAQTSGLALLMHAIHSGDVKLLGQAMELDLIIEPARRHLMPGLAEVRAAARECGAYGTIISGAGPTLCSVCDSADVANQIIDAAGGIYAQMGLAVRLSVTKPARTGFRVRVIRETGIN